MKWNWGTGIAATLLLFAGLMTFMVIKATQQRFDLVSDNYYEEEIAYQQIIDQKTNALALKGKAKLKVKGNNIVLLLPEGLDSKNKELSVLMYFEKDARKDFSWEEKSTDLNEFVVPFNSFEEGKWIAKVKLKCEGTSYYFEPQIML